MNQIIEGSGVESCGYNIGWVWTMNLPAADACDSCDPLQEQVNLNDDMSNHVALHVHDRRYCKRIEKRLMFFFTVNDLSTFL